MCKRESPGKSCITIPLHNTGIPVLWSPSPALHIHVRTTSQVWVLIPSQFQFHAILWHFANVMHRVFHNPHPCCINDNHNDIVLLKCEKHLNILCCVLYNINTPDTCGKHSDCTRTRTRTHTHTRAHTHTHTHTHTHMHNVTHSQTMVTI